MKRGTRSIKLLVLAAAPLVILELALRVLGIGGSVIYEENPVYGYRQKPSQRFSTLGRPITIDSRGFRGPVKESELLCIGCSVTYGCAFVKDEETFAARLGAVNGGVNGWGVRNMSRFLRQLDLTGFRKALWTIPTGDAVRPFTTLRNGLISTNRRMWFRTEYLLRYIWYGLLGVGATHYSPSQQAYEDNLKELRQAWGHLKERDVRLYIVFVPTQQEALGQPSRAAAFRDKMMEEVQESGIEHFFAVPTQDVGAMYHDGSHLSPKGHAWLAQEISRRFDL